MLAKTLCLWWPVDVGRFFINYFSLLTHVNFDVRCERTLSDRFSLLSAALPLCGLLLHPPLRLKRFLECPLTAPLALTRSARFAPFCFSLRSRSAYLP